MLVAGPALPGVAAPPAPPDPHPAASSSQRSSRSLHVPLQLWCPAATNFRVETPCRGLCTGSPRESFLPKTIARFASFHGDAQASSGAGAGRGVGRRGVCADRTAPTRNDSRVRAANASLRGARACQPSRCSAVAQAPLSPPHLRTLSRTPDGVYFPGACPDIRYDAGVHVRRNRPWPSPCRTRRHLRAASSSAVCLMHLSRGQPA